MVRCAIIFTVAAGIVGWAALAHAEDCDPRAFMIQNITSIQQSGETELAFVLTSSRQEFDSVKKSGGLSGSYGLISGSANYDEAKQKAEQIAQSINFDYRQSSASSIFLQQISPVAAAAYSECLNKNRETQGLTLWFQKKEGDYVTLRAFWVGNKDQATAAFDEDPVVDGGEIVAKPKAWSKAHSEKIVVKQNPGEDLFVSLAVGGETNSIIVVKAPPTVVWQQGPVSAAPPPMRACSHGPNPGCTAGQAGQCVEATHPGGRFLDDTWAVANKTSSDPSRYKEKFEKKGLGKVCVTIEQDTGACEVNQCAGGVLTATETYPRVAK